MDAKIIELCVQAGAVGLCFYLIYTMKKLVGNHINHNTQALKELCVVLAELKQLINDRL